MISNVSDLCAYFGVECGDRWFQRLNRRVYKNTECGASISVYGTLDGAEVAYHNGHGEPIPDRFALTDFTIQTIVEGSEATVDSDVFAVPVEEASVEAWIETMEGEADRLWQEANGD